MHASIANDALHAKESKFHGNWPLNYQLKGAVIKWQLSASTHALCCHEIAEYEISAYKIHDITFKITQIMANIQSGTLLSQVKIYNYLNILLKHFPTSPIFNFWIYLNNCKY